MFSVFEVALNTEQKVFEQFGYSRAQADSDVEIILKWLNTQSHLPEVFGIFIIL